MALAARNPNTIILAGNPTLVHQYPGLGTITPGMVLEWANDSGTLSLQAHGTADDPIEAMVAMELSENNKGIDDTYAAGDVIKAGILRAGDQFYGLIPSGQNITQGARLQSNGNGMLKAHGSGVAKFVAVETTGAVTVTTRIRVEVLV